MPSAGTALKHCASAEPSAMNSFASAFRAQPLIVTSCDNTHEHQASEGLDKQTRIR
jgi:hypothetical protein